MGTIAGKLAALLSSAADDPIREQAREYYARLGQGLLSNQLRDELDHVQRASDRGKEQSRATLDEVGDAAGISAGRARSARETAGVTQIREQELQLRTTSCAAYCRKTVLF